MATTVYSLVNDYAALDDLPHGDVNSLADTVELAAVQLAELMGPGCYLASNFNGTIVPGALSVEVSSGLAIVGTTAHSRKIVRKTGTTTVTGLTPSATNSVYLGQDGTFSLSSGATKLLVLTCVTNGTQVTSVTNLPVGRVNLISVSGVKVSANDGQAGYLNGKLVAGSGVTLTEGSDQGNETLTIASTAAGITEVTLNAFKIDCTVNEDRTVLVDFTVIGSWASATDYTVRIDHDQDDAKTLIFEQDNDRTGTQFRFLVQNASDATAGTYQTAADLLVTVKLYGLTSNWTAGAGGNPTVTTSTVDYGSAANPFVQGGNSFGTTATLGTNDNNSLVLETNNTGRITIGATPPDITVGAAGNGLTTFYGGFGLEASLTTATVTLNKYSSPFRPVDATAGNITITLPTAVGTYVMFSFVRKDASANTVTIDGNGSETINGALTYALASQYSAVTIMSDGANWFIVNKIT